MDRRPNHLKKDKRFSKTQSSAKLWIKKNLWWLSGFPAGDADHPCRWVAVSLWDRQPTQIITLKSTYLSKAVYALKKLRGEFPRALPRLVGDADRWFRTNMIMIEALKSSVHEGRPLPDYPDQASQFLSTRCWSLCETLRSQGLQDLLNMAIWHFGSQPEKLSQLLPWLAEENDRLVELFGPHLPPLERARFLYLARLVLDHRAQTFHPLIQELIAWKSRKVPLTMALDELKKLRGFLNRKFKKPKKKHAQGNLFKEPQANTIQKDLHCWIEGLYFAPKKEQQARVRLLLLVIPNEIGQQWETWWSNMRDLYRPLRLLLRQSATDPTFHAGFQDIEPRLSNLENTLPKHFNWSEFYRRLKLVIGLMGPDLPLKALQLVTDKSLRLFFLTDWYFSLYEMKEYGPAPGESSQFHHYMIELIAYLKRNQNSQTKALIPWHERWSSLNSAMQYTLMDDAINLFWDRTQSHLFFSSLDSIIALNDKHLIIRAAIKLFDLIENRMEHQQLANFAIESAKRNATIPFNKQVSQIACRLSEGDAGRFIRLITLLDSYDDDGNLEFLTKPLDDLEQCGFTQVYRIADLEPYLNRILNLGPFMTMAGPSPSDLFSRKQVAPPSWFAEYPDELHPALDLLEVSCPTARIQARKLFGKSFRSNASKHTELQSLQLLVSQCSAEKRTHLQKRIINLHQQIKESRKPSSKDLSKLAQRIRRFALRNQLNLWEQGILRRLLANLGNDSFLGLRVLIQEGRYLTLASHLMSLPRKFHQPFLIHLMRVTDDKPQPEFPSNLEFIKKITQQGIDIKPWLQGIGVRSFDSPAGPVHWSFEDDPLETLRMGGYFKTCLSPGSFNFFSAVANVVDVNKRVLFGRDCEGKVVARCLLALSDLGGLLTFRVYQYNPAIDCTSMVRTFTKELCERMNTLSVTKGRVACLVVPDWYDDGAEDNCGQFPFLNESSVFRTKLPKLDKQAFHVHLKEGFGDLSLNALTYPLVFNLPEFRKNRRLMASLMPEILTYFRYLEPDTLLEVAATAIDIKELPVARQLLRYHHQTHVHCDRSLELWFVLNPSELLRFLKRKKTQPYLFERNRACFSFWMGRTLSHLKRNKQALSQFHWIMSKKGTEYKKYQDWIREHPEDVDQSFETD